MSKNSLNTQILVGALLGLIFGLLLNQFGQQGSYHQAIIYLCTLAGGVFIGLLKMILIPLVFTSLAVGVTQLKASGEASQIWKLSLIYFASTSALAVLLGIIVVNIVKPGLGVHVDMLTQASAPLAVQKMSLPDFIQNFILNLFINPIQAMAQGQVLPVLIFAIFFGVACVALPQKSQHITRLLEESFAIIMKLVHWIMRLAPLGIAGLLTKLLAEQDLALLSQLATFIAVVIGTTLFHGFVQLPILLLIFGQRSPC